MDSPQLLSIVKGLLGREGGTYIVYQNSRDHLKKWQSLAQYTVPMYCMPWCLSLCEEVERKRI